METILITGGTGLIGSRLTTLLTEKGYRIIILTRTPKENTNHPLVSHSYWDPERKIVDEETVRSADHIIHLAGAGVMDKRWTDKYKQQIVDSRVLGGALLAEVLSKNKGHVKTFISGSAIGWYGADHFGGHPFTEMDAASNDFLGQTCVAWEESVLQLKDKQIRVCYVRTGIVLSSHGGALKEFMKPITWGVAGILGNGKQMVSWIHVDDLCRIFIHLVEHENCEGAYNGVAPYPISNMHMVKAIAKIKKGNWYLPMYVPAFILKLMIGEGSIEILKSTTVSAEKIMNTGFKFDYPQLHNALQQLLYPEQ